jgi:hypothetical protein
MIGQNVLVDGGINRAVRYCEPAESILWDRCGEPSMNAQRNYSRLTLPTRISDRSPFRVPTEFLGIA